MMRPCIGLSEKMSLEWILFFLYVSREIELKGKFPTPFLCPVPVNQRHEQ
jgi:hypothetical protein